MTTVERFIFNLIRAKNDNQRCDAACQLKNYIAGDLQEEGPGGEKYSKFVDELNHKIVTLSNSSDVADKKAAVLSIVALIEADSKSFSQPQRYNKSLSTINLSCNDDATLRLSTWAMGRLARAEGNLYDRFIEPVMDRAFEILDEKVKSSRESNASSKMAAILIIREMAINAPTYFFHKLNSFRELIVKVLKDQKKEIRFAAIAALRASLTIVAQRETNIHNVHSTHDEENETKRYYRELLREAQSMLTKDDEVRGGIMIIIEMLRTSTMRQELLVYEENCFGGPDKISLLKLIGLSSLERETACLIQGHDPTDSSLLYDIPKNVFGEEGHHFSQQCRKLINEYEPGENVNNFIKIGQGVEKVLQKNYKNSEVQFLLTEVLPRLAAFDSSTFQEYFLSETFRYLTTQAKNFKPSGLVSPKAFLAIGQIAYSMQDGIICYIDKIFTVIKPYIPNPLELAKYRRSINTQVEGNVLQLISLLAKATRDKFHISICDCIDGMLWMTLTKALTDCLAVLHANVPAVKNKIQDGLLNIFSRIIMNLPYIKEDKPYPEPMDWFAPTDVQSKLLAIRTIGEFKFDDKLLKPFITHLAKEYLNDPNFEIRRETAKTCTRKLVPCVKATNAGVNLVGARVYSPHTMMTDVLTKLLAVVVADPLAEIRLATLREFNTDFHKQLALSENIQMLFLAVNDPSHDVREVVLELLGHLSDENPAYILPFLREQLSHILHQFEHSGIARNKEKAAKLLHILIKSAQPTLVRLYLKPIMSILMPKLKSPELSSSLFRHILGCISQLAEVDGATMMTYLDELFPFLIKRISDLKEREPSLRAMYYLVRHTGYVVKPYQEYPELLNTLLNIISTENSADVRGDCMRLLGQLGALSPYKNNKVNLNELRKFPITQPVPMEAVSFDTGLTSELLIQKQSDKDFNMEKQYYPCVVIHALMNILQDKTLNEYHSQVVQIIITVFQRLGSVGTVGYLPKVMPTFLENVKTSEPKVVDSYFNKLADLTKIVGIHIKPYANDIIKLIIDFWNKGSDSDTPFQNTIMMVVERLINALGGEFKTYIAQLIPLIMKVLHDDQSLGREATKRLLGQLKNFGTTLDNYLHLLLPQIVAIIGDTSNEMDIRRRAVRTIRDISEYADYSEHASLMLHTLVASLDSTQDPDFKADIMNAILAIAKQLGFRFRIFKQLVLSAVLGHQLIVPEFEAFLTQLNTTDLVLPVVPPLEVSGRQQDMSSSESTISKLPVDVDQLASVWEVKNLFPKDLVLWLRQLKIEFLKYTPNPALRACFMLAHYQNLAEDLFNAVFVSIWSDQLTEHQQDKLGENLKKVLENQSIPEVTLAILNLQEFMEHWGKGTLDIRNEVFAKAAKKCNSYAKALHYTEKDFLQQEPGTLVELLRINNTLQQPKAALGVLKYAQMNPSKLNTPEDSWYEELQQWDEALSRYNEKLDQNLPDKTSYVLGKLRCLESLNRWEEMQKTIDSFWSETSTNVNERLLTRPRAGSDVNQNYRVDNLLSPEDKASMASLAATASWRLSNWEHLRHYTDKMDMNYQKNFFSAVSAIEKKDYLAAQDLIDQSRETLDQEITVIVKEGYHRLYTKIVDMHMLSEMEEVVAFKKGYYSNCREYKTESEMINKRNERKDRLREVWWQRLQGCQRNVNDWSRILEVHKLVLSPKEDERAWLKFSSIARRDGRLDLSKKILLDLIGKDPSKFQDSNEWLESTQSLSPYVVYQYLKYQWNDSRDEDGKIQAYQMLNSYVKQGLDRVDRSYFRQDIKDDRRLRSKYKLKQGMWLYSLNEGNHSNSNPAEGTLEFFREAKEMDNKWYKSWHLWAMMNFNAAQPEKLKSLKDEFRVVNERIKELQGVPLDVDDEDEEDLDDDVDDIDSDDEVSEGGHDSSIIRLPDPSANGDSGPEEPGSVNEIIPLPREPKSELENEELQRLLLTKDRLYNDITYKYSLITAAVSGFIESITLSLDTNLLQDILRLLTLWFTHGSNRDVSDVLQNGVMRIPIKTWMQVIPQLIARIDMPDRSVRDLIHQVLNDVGREHPQALIYPLSVAKRSSDCSRGDYAKKLLDLMTEHTPQVVQEGVMFSNELIRIAISWNEQWHEALEKASSKWFQEKNAKGMFEILSPMHKLVNPEFSNPDAVNNLTDLEKSFKNVNGSDLAEAYDWCKQYNKSKDSKAEEYIRQAWDCYFKVYKRIGLSISSMNTVRLEDASPILLHQARSMELVVPGTYDPGQPIIKIHSINPSVGVIKSKIRPRKLSMIGSNGKTYTFLLKGNEDLRQDERAMQLFGLVNSLLAHSQKTAQQNLSIQRYSVIPLSPHSGLSGWRPHSDTLHLLIKEHRERNKVTPTLETKLCQKFCFCYEKLPLMMKIEVFEEVLNITTGEDLALILYQRSPSAEVWFDRRKNYILSHAVMSMVGYILGLGDRHPSNIMMDRKTGNLIHCDFGECFDVSRDREKYPEKVPFRLTRMMQKAMEVTGIHGTYTMTCNDVMEVLRNNENSILAVLETFVYDPLINWRLVEDYEVDGHGRQIQERNNETKINKKAVEILEKVKKKLTGFDDITEKYLDVENQVQSLIKQATATENLCQLYMGWCPFW